MNPAPATSIDQSYQVIDLTKIIPSKTNPRTEFDEASIKELADSIRVKGVIEPIIVRSNGKPGHFELVCGARRLKASKLAERPTIPAIVRHLTDDEAFDLQITENLQRKDVHPMDEAVAFKTLLEQKKYTTAEIAARFGKSESFVVQRIKLNDLIPDAQKKFFQDLMLLGHALLLCRLTPEDQKAAISANKSWSGPEMKSVPDLERYINQNVMHNLSSSAFKKDDPSLLPAAGACINCTKRSGSNPSLFPDIKEKDRCFDGACFEQKRNLHTLNAVKEVLEDEPGVFLLKPGFSNDNIQQEITTLASSYKVAILERWKAFNESSKKESKLQGIYVCGDEAGKRIYIKLAKKTSESTGNASNARSQTSLDIAAIKQRTERSAELDDEKVFARILNDIKSHRTQEGFAMVMTEAEHIAMWWHLIDEVGYDKILKGMIDTDWDDEEAFEKIYKRILKLTDVEKAYIMRQVFMDKHGGNYPRTVAGMMVKRMAASYGDIPIKKYEDEQKAIREKREGRATQRIEALKKQDKRPAKRNDKDAATIKNKKS